MLVSDIVRRNAAYFGDNDAVVVPGGRVSDWTEMEVRSNKLANALVELGLRKGDRLAAFMPNGGEYLDFFFACAKSGIVGATLNIRLTGADLVGYLSLIEPSAILVHADLAGGTDWIERVGSIRHVIGVGEGHGYELDLEVMIAAADATDPGCDIGPDDTYQLGATSGTTGTPKGAILTHRNAISAMLNWMADMPIPAPGTQLQAIPMFFNPGGPAGIHPVLMKGGRSVIHPGFDPGAYLEAIPTYGVTNSILVPTMVGMLLDHPDVEKYDMSSLVAISTGGSPLPRDVLTRALDIFGDVFFPLYGMAETYSCGAILRREDQYVEGTSQQVGRLASIGRPAVLMQVRVVGDDGNDVPRDNETPGEIWMKGDSVSAGYFRQPEETVASRHGDWMKSGDLAVMDEDGFITIVDRSKDIIISGGINVYSRDIEEVLYDHPAVALAAAIGIPHPKWGEAIHAIVTLSPGAIATPDELMEYAAANLADYKKPRSLDIVDSMPIGGTGKILKRELRAPYWEGSERRV